MVKPVVLIVDDEEGIRETLSGIFEDEGCSIVTANSPPYALSIGFCLLGDAKFTGRAQNDRVRSPVICKFDGFPTDT